MRPSALLLAGLAAVPSAPAAGQVPAARIDSVFAAHQGTHGPGCAVSVVRRGDPAFARGYGMADLAQGLAITPRSVFHVASVSKQFAGMSLVLLAQAGRLSLDDDVRRYVPELPDPGAPLTLRRLLNHTSGIRDQWNLLMSAGWRLGDDLITEQDVLDVLGRQRALNFAPGAYWYYSNSGFTLAAVVVKRVTGRSLREFADSALFRPLGMASTHFHDDNLMIVPGRTRGHTRRGGEWKETVPNYSTVGATSLFTTVEDLAVWQQQLATGRVGGREAIAMLTTPGVLTNGDTLAYALGIVRGTYRGAATLSHSGGDPGYSSHLLHFPATGSGVAVLCNSSGVANPVRLAEQTADIALADELGPVADPPPQATAAAVAGYEGVWFSELAEAVGRIVVESDGAGWRVGQGTVRLRTTGVPGRFLLGNGPATIELRPDGTILHRGGMGEPAVYARTAEWTPGPADRAALAGRYYSPELDVTWEIRAAGDTLRLHRRKFEPGVLTPAFRGAWTAGSVLNFLIRPLRDRSGRVTGFTAGSGRVRAVRFDRVGPPGGP
jgi:CubicO group peptidase (beta-lactamase class C family)